MPELYEQAMEGKNGKPSAAAAKAVQTRYRARDYWLRRALLAADMAGLWLALALALALSDARAEPIVESLWILPTLPFWAFLFWGYRLYGRAIRRFGPTHIDDAPSLFHAVIIGTLGLWLFYRFIAPVGKLALPEVIVFGLMALLLIACLRALLRARYARALGPERIFVVAPPEEVELLHRKLADHPEYGMSIVGSVTQDACDTMHLSLRVPVEDLSTAIGSGKVDHVIVCLNATYLPQQRVQELMRACHREGVRFSCFPAAKGLLPPGVEVNHLEGLGLLTSPPPVLSRVARWMKRCLDLAVSALALAVLSPLLALIAAAIKLDSRGPVLFRQLRVGTNGERFELIKFRTMVEDADRLTAELMEDSIDPNWLFLEKDPRVTRVGRFLRKSSLDELPQLWNVVRGDMSLVGPRPLSERDDCRVQGWRRNRLDLLPGITGYWQVLGRTNIPFEEMLELDYAYVTSWSLWHDIKLLLKTVPVVLRGRGAN